MKKLVLFVFITTTICSCIEQPSSHKKIIVPGHIGSTQIEKVEYEGHTYITFEGDGIRGVEHDPDCKCYKKI